MNTETRSARPAPLPAPLLIWKGELSRAMILKLRMELLGAMRGTERFTVNLEAVKSFDISCLLLLCAAKRYADSMEQTLVVEGVENVAVHQVIQEYGYGGNSYCLGQCRGRCLWGAHASSNTVGAAPRMHVGVNHV